jgi:hypothetical protein
VAGKKLSFTRQARGKTPGKKGKKNPVTRAFRLTDGRIHSYSLFMIVYQFQVVNSRSSA